MFPFRFVMWTAVLVLAGCSTTHFELESLPVPILSNDAGFEGAERQPFEERRKSILWVHGLFGESVPDIASIVGERAAGADAIVDFRVAHGAVFHDWLITHLSLTLIRMKTVTIRGAVVRERSGVAPL